MNVLKELNAVLDALENAPARAAQYKAEVTRLDLEHSDLTHAMEKTPPENFADLLRLTEEIKRNRKARREAKDMLIITEPLAEAVKTYPASLKLLRDCRYHLTKKDEYINRERTYTPRANNEIANEILGKHGGLRNQGEAGR